jgi:hypothetical protein
VPDAVELLKQARNTRDLASRAKRRALTLSDPADKDRLLRHAEELIEQAEALEKRAILLRRAPIF